MKPVLAVLTLLLSAVSAFADTMDGTITAIDEDGRRITVSHDNTVTGETDERRIDAGSAQFSGFASFSELSVGDAVQIESEASGEDRTFKASVIARPTPLTRQLQGGTTFTASAGPPIVTTGNFTASAAGTDPNFSALSTIVTPSGTFVTSGPMVSTNNTAQAFSASSPAGTVVTAGTAASAGVPAGDGVVGTAPTAGSTSGQPSPQTPSRGAALISGTNTSNAAPGSQGSGPATGASPSQ